MTKSHLQFSAGMEFQNHALEVWELPKKTPEEDIKRFEKFVEAMEDIEYEYWYNFEASKAQKDLADNLREVLEEDSDEVDDLMTTHRDALRRFYSRWNK